MRFVKSTGAVLTALIFGSILTTNLFAQDSKITGTVVSSDGKMVPYVSITATNTADGLERIGNSDASGNFTIDQLTPGAYKLKVEAPGYEIPEVPGLTLAASDSKKVDFTLTMTTTERMFRKTYPFFSWWEETWVGNAIRNHQYPFAIIEVVHLFGLTLLLGGIF